MNLGLICSIFFVYLLECIAVSDYPRDPYATLGVSKRASAKEVKRAYKLLAKEWHPDKNSSPEAQEKFVAISKAYEILSDPLRRERFDKFGTLDDTTPSNHHNFGGFDHFFGGFGGFEDGLFGKQRISLRQYTNSILEKTYNQPFILYAYSNYCQLCFRLQSQWKSVTEDLEPLGYGIGTVNAMTDGNLLEKLRISRLPAIVAVVEGRTIHLRADMYTLNARTVRVFARDVIPKTFLNSITTHDKLKKFVDQWKSTNKVSVLILGATAEPRTRYLLAAMKYSHFARFAYVHLAAHSDEIASMREALAIKCIQCENILVFNDFPETGPVARLSISNANQLTIDALNSLIDGNKFLTMPRLSSSNYLDELCPVSSRNQRRLCGILPIMNTASDTEYIDSYRMYAKDNKKRLDDLKVQLVYMFASKQSAWLEPFLQKRKGDTISSARDILIIWRLEHMKARFIWLLDAWNGDGTHLDLLLDGVVKQTTKLDETTHIISMVDEFSPSWWTRACRATVRMCEAAWFHLTKEEAYPVLSAIATFLLIIIVGYGLNYMNQEGRPRKEKPRVFSTDEWHPEDPKANCDPPKVNQQARLQRIMSIMSPHIHELRAESYFGMIRLLKPGCRSLILLTDEQNKDRLLKEFAQYIYPLRNNKTFSFGYLLVDKNLPWFRKLLEHTLPLRGNSVEKDGGSSLYEKLKAINPRQTVGTVLVLCGWKLYFSIYHPMHTSGKKKHFLGFDDVSTNSDDSGAEANKEDEIILRSTIVNVENVLNGFPIWLDRLLEGSIRRYYIPEWPDNLR